MHTANADLMVTEMGQGGLQPSSQLKHDVPFE